MSLLKKKKTDKAELENKIPDVTDFAKKTKLTELENKIPDASSLVTNSALTAVEIKIPNVSSLVKQTNYNTKILELEKNLLFITMASILLLQSLIIYLLTFLIQD